MGGGILNNNIISSQDNDVLSFTKTLQSQKNIKNQNILKDINISTNQETSKLSNFFAFSLIELSIVLIIIGLLVAGITGGQSLIKSAKLRAFMNELSGYKQAVYTFYASKGRLPGDLNNLGTMGRSSGQTYTSSSFPAPYNTTVPNEYSAPFIDLYLEKIIDFKPSETKLADYSGTALPRSKIYKNSHYLFHDLSATYYPSYFIYSPKFNSPYLRLYIPSADISNIASDFKFVDQKMDDGIYNSGTIRTYCYASGKSWGEASYDDVINDKGNTQQCSSFWYNMGF